MSAKSKPVAKKVCFPVLQLRLDLMNFVITGPTTSTLTITKQKAQSGVVNAAGDQAVAAATQCQTDTFSVTNPGGATPPTICGINTGEHSERRKECTIVL